MAMYLLRRSKSVNGKLRSISFLRLCRGVGVIFFLQGGLGVMMYRYGNFWLVLQLAQIWNNSTFLSPSAVIGCWIMSLHPRTCPLKSQRVKSIIRICFWGQWGWMLECYRSDYYLVKQACSIVLCKNVFAVHLHIFFCIFLCTGLWMWRTRVRSPETQKHENECFDICVKKWVFYISAFGIVGFYWGGSKGMKLGLTPLTIHGC